MTGKLAATPAPQEREGRGWRWGRGYQDRSVGKGRGRKAMGSVFNGVSLGTVRQKRGKAQDRLSRSIFYGFRGIGQPLLALRDG